MNNFFTFVDLPFSLIFFSEILSRIFIGIWTYKDAKSKNNNYILWTILVIFIPYYLGLIAYFLFGRKVNKIICRNCNEYTDSDKQYCSNCGEKLEHKDDIIYNKDNKIWAVLAILFFVISIIIPMNLFGSNFSMMRNYNRVIPGFFNMRSHYEMMRDYDNNMMNDYENHSNMMNDHRRNSSYFEESYSKRKDMHGREEIKRTDNTFSWKFKKSNKKITNNIIYNKNNKDNDNINLDYKIKSGKVIGKIFIRGNEINAFELNDKSNTLKFNLSELAKGIDTQDSSVKITFVFYPEEATGNINMDYK